MIITTSNEDSQSQNSPTLTQVLQSELFTEYSDLTDFIPESSSTGSGLESLSQRPPLSEQKYLIVSNDVVTQAQVENILTVLLQITL